MAIDKVLLPINRGTAVESYDTLNFSKNIISVGKLAYLFYICFKSEVAGKEEKSSFWNIKKKRERRRLTIIKFHNKMRSIPSMPKRKIYRLHSGLLKESGQHDPRKVNKPHEQATRYSTIFSRNLAISHVTSVLGFIIKDLDRKFSYKNNYYIAWVNPHDHLGPHFQNENWSEKVWICNS